MQPDQNQGEKEMTVQEQLLESQKKFRNLESDRKAYAEETVANIKKQRGIIDKLKNENYILKDLIAKMNSQKLQVNQTAYSKGPNIDTLIDDLKVAINEEKKMQDEIDQHVDDFQKKIIEKRHALGGYNAGAENESALQKQIKILENRLDKTNQKFNEAIAINKQLRQQIDSLRRERVIFDNLYKKLEKELHEKRKEMADIIETANTAYEERDKANDLIQSLKQQAKRESSDFEKDLRELSQIMEKNKKTLDYMKLTEKNREMDNQEVDADKYQKPKQKLVRDKTVNQTIVEQILKYEEDFAKIQAATQIKDFEHLVSIFKKNEEKNFQMFKFVNEQSNDIEDVEKQNGELRAEASLYDGQGTNIDLLRKRHLKELEEKLSRAEGKSEQYEFKHNEAIKLISSLTNWIETLFNTVECDKQMAQEIAGSHQVTDTNMMVYLGLIENKVNKLLQFYQQIHQKISENQISTLSQLAAMNEKMLQNKNRSELPQFDEHEDEDNEGDKILTLDDFRKRALDKLEVCLTLKQRNNQTQQRINEEVQVNCARINEIQIKMDYKIHLIGGKIENSENLKKADMSSSCKFEQARIEINLDFAPTIVKSLNIKLSGAKSIFAEYISFAQNRDLSISHRDEQLLQRNPINNGSAYAYMQPVRINQKIDRIKLKIERAESSNIIKIFYIEISNQSTMDHFKLNPTFSSDAGSHANFTSCIESGRDPVGRPIQRTETNYIQQQRAVYKPEKSRREQEDEEFQRALRESMKGVDNMQVEEEVYEEPKKQFEEKKYASSLGYSHPQAKIYGLKNNIHVQEWKRPEKKEKTHSNDDTEIRLDLMMKLTPSDIDPKFWEFHRALEKSRGRKDADLLENNFYK